MPQHQDGSSSLLTEPSIYLSNQPGSLPHQSSADCVSIPTNQLKLTQLAKLRNLNLQYRRRVLFTGLATAFSASRASARQWEPTWIVAGLASVWVLSALLDVTVPLRSLFASASNASPAVVGRPWSARATAEETTQLQTTRFVFGTGFNAYVAGLTTAAENNVPAVSTEQPEPTDVSDNDRAAKSTADMSRLISELATRNALVTGEPESVNFDVVRAEITKHESVVDQVPAAVAAVVKDAVEATAAVTLSSTEPLVADRVAESAAPATAPGNAPIPMSQAETIRTPRDNATPDLVIDVARRRGIMTRVGLPFSVGTAQLADPNAELWINRPPKGVRFTHGYALSADEWRIPASAAEWTHVLVEPQVETSFALIFKFVDGEGAMMNAMNVSYVLRAPLDVDTAQPAPVAAAAPGAGARNKRDVTTKTATSGNSSSNQSDDADQGADPPAKTDQSSRPSESTKPQRKLVKKPAQAEQEAARSSQSPPAGRSALGAEPSWPKPAFKPAPTITAPKVKPYRPDNILNWPE